MRLVHAALVVLVGCVGPTTPATTPAAVPAPAPAPVTIEHQTRDLFVSLVAMARSDRPLADYVVADQAARAATLAMILRQIHCEVKPEVSPGPGPFPDRDPGEQSLLVRTSCMNNDSVHTERVTVEPTHQQTWVLFVHGESGLRAATWRQVH